MSDEASYVCDSCGEEIGHFSLEATSMVLGRDQESVQDAKTQRRKEIPSRLLVGALRGPRLWR